MAEGEEKVTKFNSALASLERLHKLLDSCHEYSTLAMIPNDNIFERVSYLKTYKSLVSRVFKEIYPKLNEIQLKHVNNAFNRFSKFPKIIVTKYTEEGQIPHVDSRAFAKHMAYVSRIEEYLRLVADKRGMLIPDQLDDFLKPENW